MAITTPVSVIITLPPVTTPVGILARASTELIPRAFTLRMGAKRGNKRVFVQKIARKLKIKHKQALEFVGAYTEVVMQGVRDDGHSLLPDIGSLTQRLRKIRSQADKNEAKAKKGGGKYKKAYVKFSPCLRVRKECHTIVDESTWNPRQESQQ